MGSRERILARIRRAQGRGGDVPPESERDLVRQYLASHPRGPLRDFGPDIVACFRERAAASASTLDAVASEREVPAAVARFLAAHGIEGRGCVWPTFATLDWAGAGVLVEARAARGEDAVGVTGVYCAIAETGTLCVLSGADSPASASLVPETHVAIVPAGRIVGCMEEAWDLMRAEFGRLPRAVNYISGPSRTADIEQTVVLGAHGPARVHVVIVG
jgi:L-lactate dehydrogenase complex protein LldG